ncbi:type II secretion system inner membrane protein GspF [Echinimonas agarilytica]|uniref:General secretion pathway protein F n=1 Tax=Echinimonas agarilytica TaxID=1215918 RepID=A0AA41W7V2_9GAMM|nr:type II secretion system inner membrane protein GspF [Echinimonas agarilytica]MCM2680892.1 type II secretion system inner membrane protein GspF [Echinimonas agarilytica]
MAVFQYKAISKAGKPVKGIEEADTARQARQSLREKGLMPTEVSEVTGQKSKTNDSKAQTKSFRGRISTADLSLITRQLATLVASGLPLEESLHAVAQQSEKAKLGSMIMAVRARVLEGYSLADSLSGFPQIFDELFCATVAAGEKSGHLDTVLNRLADFTEKRDETKGKVTQAMVYPIVLTVIAIAVVSALLAVVVPKVVEQFVTMGQTLPLATRILMGASDFVIDYGIFVLIGSMLFAVGVQRYLSVQSNRLKWHRVQLKLPVIGKVVRGMNTARFARTLSILTASSVPLLESMKIAGDVLLNLHMKQALVKATERVREGSSLRASLQETKLFPPIMLHMIASGEKSGELEQMLGRAADNQDREFDSQITIALGLLGPLVLVLMAAVVLFIVIAILQPILDMQNLVG